MSSATPNKNISQDAGLIVSKMRKLNVMPPAVSELTGIPVERIMNVINQRNPDMNDVKKLKKFLKL